MQMEKAAHLASLTTTKKYTNHTLKCQLSVLRSAKVGFDTVSRPSSALSPTLPSRSLSSFK